MGPYQRNNYRLYRKYVSKRKDDVFYSCYGGDYVVQKHD